MPAWTSLLYRALLALAALAPAGARATERLPIIWYRFSGECPTGEQFVSRLDALGQKARLAGVQDSVDFVVTLGSSEGRSQGRLERQTTAGTVAIRDVQAENCDSVGKALAFSLVLTLNPDADIGDPGSEGPAPSATATRPPSDSSASETASPPESPPREAPSAPSAKGAEPVGLQGGSPMPTGANASSTSGGPAHAAYRLGAEVGASWGITPAIQPRAGVSLSYQARAWPAQPAFRATALGGYGRSETSSGDLRAGLGAVDLEACAWGWSDGVTGVEPCAGVELGFVFAENEGPTGRADSGLWATGFVRGRVHHAFGRHWGLEAHLGGFAPWFRYDYGGTDRMKPVGFEGALGAFFGLD